MPILSYKSLLLLLLAFTPLSDAATSYREMLCEMVHPELKACRLQCPDGKAWKDGCPMCLCRSDLCQQKYCYLGQRCSIIQTIGQYADQFSDVAVCEPENRYIEVSTQPPTEAPHPPSTQAPTEKEFLGSCDFLGRCDVNGSCDSQDAVCRKDGWCCRVKRDDYNMGADTDMAKCMDTPDVGQCRALGTQYVYRKGTGKCEAMMYGGCVNSANSFPTMEKCQQTCEHPCQMPKTLGRCRASIPRYYFNEDTEACEAFDLGGCAGTANYFMTPWDCEAHCKGLKKSVKRPTKNPNRSQALTNPPTAVAPTPSSYQPAVTGSGNQNERENLRYRIINGFHRTPGFDTRGNPVNVKVDYKPRPQPETPYTVDANGNIIYNNNDNNRPQTTMPNPTTAYMNRNINNNYKNKNEIYSHLGDRVRSAPQVPDNFRGGQVSYRNLRSRLTVGGGDQVPAYQDRGLRSYTRPRSYQDSVDAIRRLLTG